MLPCCLTQPYLPWYFAAPILKDSNDVCLSHITSSNCIELKSRVQTTQENLFQCTLGSTTPSLSKNFVICYTNTSEMVILTQAAIISLQFEMSFYLEFFLFLLWKEFREFTNTTAAFSSSHIDEMGYKKQTRKCLYILSPSHGLMISEQHKYTTTSKSKVITFP